MYEKGGWWVDMDVTCLQPFDIKEPYFFRSHHELNVVGNVMKCPPKSELMRLCFEEAFTTVDSDKTDWHKPIVILNKYVKQLGLENYVHSGCGNPDVWQVVEEYIYSDTEPRESYLFIHWMNEEWRTKKIDKKRIPHRSTLGRLLLQYKLAEPPVGKWKLFKSNVFFLLNVFRLQLIYFVSGTKRTE